jgi:heme exporter protein A
LLFRGLDLDLASGSITWLRGTNGSGKTSLMRILAGLSQAAEGDLSWNGQPVRQAGGEARRGVIYIGHTNALKDDLTLVEAVAFLAMLAELDQPAQRARHALDRLGLASRRDAPVRTLSQGQRRRGALARLALDEQPRAWILDEPFDALDAQSVGLLSSLIEAHAARGGAVLLTSHQAVNLAGARELDLEPWRVA